MKYRDFGSYKINESNIMNSTKFGDYELPGDETCDHKIFDLYPNHCSRIYYLFIRNKELRLAGRYIVLNK